MPTRSACFTVTNKVVIHLERRAACLTGIGSCGAETVDVLLFLSLFLVTFYMGHDASGPVHFGSRDGTLPGEGEALEYIVGYTSLAQSVQG